LSVDPLAEKYAYYTPYQFASNSPISGVDVDGLEHAGIDVWNEIYYQSDTYLAKSDAERIEEARAKAKLGLTAIVGAAFIVTGGSLYEAGVNLFWRAAVWFSNPSNQALVAEGGALVISAMDPDPSAQYSAGAADELGNAIGAGIRFVFKSKSSNDIATGTAKVVDGILELEINVPPALKGQGIGRQMFQKALNLGGDRVKGIRGLWTYDSEGKMSDNLSTFLKNWDYLGGSFKANDAAFTTFTGKIARENGFSNVKIISSEIDEVEVLFTKSKE